ncbi:papain-like cysteine protease family protein [Streptomyces buecherae]|uniref:papain-like cysteine protease family protein n=1 Tax=Streptomyces buecherae TaxID=2763006 RepID=UPI001C25FA50|nr:papain-like cysteine protease family protein [Streptomyces buecherae]
MVPRKHRAPVGAPVTPAAPPDSAPARGRRRLTVALSGIAAVACLAAPLSGTSVAAAPPAPAPAAQAAPSDVTASTQLAFNELVQSQNQWCWVATGLSIARYLGRGQDTSQNTFCTYARGLPPTSACPNRPGYLSDVQRSWSRLGMDPGRTTGTLPFQTVQQTIDANSPVETGIYWTSGGGHAQVLYGYDASRQTVMYADPWPSSPRYAEMNYTTYRSNSQFRWAESLYGEK